MGGVDLLDQQLNSLCVFQTSTFNKVTTWICKECPRQCCRSYHCKGLQMVWYL